MRFILTLIVALVLIHPAFAASKAVITTSGMVCEVCTNAVKDAFLNQAEVAACDVNLDTQAVTVTFNEGMSLDEARVASLMQAAGFPSESIAFKE